MSQENVGEKKQINECNVRIVIEVDGDCDPSCLEKLRGILSENLKHYEVLGIKIRLVAALCALALFADLASQGALT
jgi:hypothetical protein